MAQKESLTDAGHRGGAGRRVSKGPERRGPPTPGASRGPEAAPGQRSPRNTPDRPECNV